MHRRVCAGVTLLAYLAAAIGFPMPGTTRADGSRVCGQSVCCCGTVEQCKASGCGCSHSSEQPAPVETPNSCCFTQGEPASEEPSCCSTQGEPSSEEPSCCKKTKSTKPSPKKKAASVRWVVGIAAMNCQGASTQWVSTGAALPLHAPYRWLPSWPYVHSVPDTKDLSFFLSIVPLDPPPRTEVV